MKKKNDERSPCFINAHGQAQAHVPKMRINIDLRHLVVCGKCGKPFEGGPLFHIQNEQVRELKDKDGKIWRFASGVTVYFYCEMCIKILNKELEKMAALEPDESEKRALGSEN